MTNDERETLTAVLDGVFDHYRETVCNAVDGFKDVMTRTPPLERMKTLKARILAARKDRNEHIANALDVVLGWKLDDRTSRIVCNVVRDNLCWASHDIQTMIEEMERVKAAAEAQDTKEQDIIREDA